MDTGVFNENRYFDVFVEYAKAAPEDILIKITAWNRGPEEAPLDLLPTIWFRNTWSLGEKHGRPKLWRVPDCMGAAVVGHGRIPLRQALAAGRRRAGAALHRERNQFSARLRHSECNAVREGRFHEYLLHGGNEAVNPAQTGTKCAAHYRVEIAPGASATIRLRLTNAEPTSGNARIRSDAISKRCSTCARGEADEFYARRFPQERSDDAHIVMRQALAGMLWSKQFYHYDVRTWLEGDPGQPPPPPERKKGRNHDWTHLYNADVLSMPDKWEYPWFAAWDLAFHTSRWRWSIRTSPRTN